jgi:hypothetical protein
LLSFRGSGDGNTKSDLNLRFTSKAKVYDLGVYENTFTATPCSVSKEIFFRQHTPPTAAFRVLPIRFADDKYPQ